jgi:hypothetical protein
MGGRRDSTPCNSFRAIKDDGWSSSGVKSGDALEFTLVVGDESEPRGFGVSSNPEIVATDLLTAGLQRCANLPVESF